jgi:hypothetical protein
VAEREHDLTDGYSQSRAIQSKVLVCMLGKFALLKAGREVLLRDGGKIQGLLSRLILGPRGGIRREKLIADLWPDRQPALAGQSLNSLVYNIHRLLGDGIDGASPVLQANGVYRLNFEAGVGVDVLQFEKLSEEADRLRRAGDMARAADAYQSAQPGHRPPGAGPATGQRRSLPDRRPGIRGAASKVTPANYEALRCTDAPCSQVVLTAAPMVYVAPVLARAGFTPPLPCHSQRRRRTRPGRA